MNNKKIKNKKENKSFKNKMIEKNEYKNFKIKFFFYILFFLFCLTSLSFNIFLGVSLNSKITRNKILQKATNESEGKNYLLTKENKTFKNTLKWERKKIFYKYDGKEIHLSLNDVKNVFKKEYDKKNEEIEYLFVFSIDKFKNIEKILEITSNKKHEVSYSLFNLRQKMKEKVKENENIIGFFKVHNHPFQNSGPSPIDARPSPADKLSSKKIIKYFLEDFGNNLFFDDFIYFKSDGKYMKENEYFINKTFPSNFFVKIFT